ncbi:hypothetical protein DFH94DRAFT_694995 [Russula ochroleuca]|uniref:Uncharacterized protein n=1 Tax=Russula ochroleuca TaxID=152965 RepID=A0A9P5T5L3_9AGAM|nr:hypothetical protein DFH94DRAFT_694995 [Russula ochroleuca]
MQYPKSSSESFVQRTSSFHNREHGFSTPHPPDISDSRGKVGPSSNSAPSLGRRENPITPLSASVSTQNQPKLRVRLINNGNSTVSGTNPLPLPPSLPGGSQTLATSSTLPALEIVRAPSNLEKGREPQAQPGLFPAKSRHVGLRRLGLGRVGPPLEGGPPPPGLRRGLLKKEKVDARRGNRLKLSANAEPNSTTSYTPNAIQYLKASLKGFVQRTYTSLRSREYDSSAPHFPDSSNPRGKAVLSSNSAPPFE